MGDVYCVREWVDEGGRKLTIHSCGKSCFAAARDPLVLQDPKARGEFKESKVPKEKKESRAPPVIWHEACALISGA